MTPLKQIEQSLDLAMADAQASIEIIEALTADRDKALREVERLSDALTELGVPVGRGPGSAVNTRSMMAVQAAIVMARGTDEDKAAYLRMRGWTMSGTGWYSNPSMGYETLLPLKAVEVQVLADTERFAFLLDNLRPSLVR